MKIPPRRLPISFGPVQGELLGSYLHRLADANRISVGVLTAVISEELPTSCSREQDTLSGWSRARVPDAARHVRPSSATNLRAYTRIDRRGVACCRNLLRWQAARDSTPYNASCLSLIQTMIRVLCRRVSR